MSVLAAAEAGPDLLIVRSEVWANAAFAPHSTSRGVASTPATTAVLRICRNRDGDISPPPRGARLCDSDFASVPLRRQFQRRNNSEKKLPRLPFVGRCGLAATHC